MVKPWGSTVGRVREALSSIQQDSLETGFLGIIQNDLIMVIDCKSKALTGLDTHNQNSKCKTIGLSDKIVQTEQDFKERVDMSHSQNTDFISEYLQSH